jgi:hypothetical protein
MRLAFIASSQKTRWNECERGQSWLGSKVNFLKFARDFHLKVSSILISESCVTRSKIRLPSYSEFGSSN